MNNEKNKISLNGNWFHLKDKEEKYSIEEIKKFYLTNEINEIMKIPSNWEKEGLHNFSGSVWFIKEFKTSEAVQLNDLTVLKFYGVDYFSDVWLNWEYLGEHEGYFQPFYFEIDDKIKTDSKNVLAVKVTSPKEEPGKVWPDNKKLIKGIFNHHDCRPGGWDLEHGQDYNTGGIWNSVELYYGYQIFISDVKVKSKIRWDDNKANVEIIISFLSSILNTETVKYSIKIATPPGQTIIKQDETISIKGLNEFVVKLEIDNPELWWSWDLGEQNLYSLEIGSDQFEDINLQFGIREVYLGEKKQFYLNKKKLFLRGTNIIPTQFLSELDESKIKNLASLLKEANVNIVRVHAHVNRKELYEECDKEGILVWQDFALQWTYEESEQFRNNAVTQIKDMIELLYNHPSIAFWCCHNEPGDQIKTLDIFLYGAVKESDNTRIISVASNYEEHPYDGWYWGNKEHFAATPMGPLVTEFGAQAIPERSSLESFIDKEAIDKPDWKKWQYHNFQYEQTFNVAEIEKGEDTDDLINNSQNYQADLLKTAIDFYRRKRFNGIIGIFQFMFIDCWSSITWSVVDFYGKKKKGFYALKQTYQPVYVSVNLRQKKYFSGSDLQIDLWIINDLYERYADCLLKITIEGREIFNSDKIEVDENSLQFIDYKKINAYLPESLQEGSYKVSYRLYDKMSKKVLSQNENRIEIVENEF